MKQLYFTAEERSRHNKQYIKDYVSIADCPEYELVKPSFTSKGFKNNPKLKKPGMPFEWTEQGVREYAKCAQDPIYFLENYVKIIHGDYGLIPFKLRPYQREMIEAIHNERRVIMCMSRQSGKSTAVIGYILWYILFNEHRTAALLANKEKTALELLAKAHLAYMHLPLFLQQGLMEWNKGSIALENGSRVIADATASDTIRGYTVSLLCIDEVANIENWNDFSTSTIPTISSMQTSKIIQISTPRGLNHFYQTWMNAQPDAKNPNGYKPIMVHWTQVPGRDDKWKDMALQELNHDLDKFAQEYECEFLGSSGTLIAGWKLKEMMHYTAGIRPIYSNEALKKYKNPQQKHNYCITVDTSEGKGLDYNVANVFDITSMPYEQVAIYRSNQSSPSEFAQIIYELGKNYNFACILIELNCAVGGQVSDCLWEDYNYDNLLYTKNRGSQGIQITTEGGKSVYRGLKQTLSTRRTGCSLAKLLIEQNKIIINDFETAREFATFSRDENATKFEAEQGCHDDAVMTVVIFAWLSDQAWFSETTDIKTLSKLRLIDEATIEEDLVPFGFVDRGAPAPIINNIEHDDIFYRRKDGEYVSWLNWQPEPDDEDGTPINF